MGQGHRRYEDMLAGSTRAARDARARADALETAQMFNGRLASGRSAWFWPTIGAALVTKHHWLRVVCDGCETVIELDLSVKRRNPDAPVSAALPDVRCPRCNGHGRPRVIGLARFPS
jgi:hypothetical protein